jgi:hypothetical protein
MSRIPNNLINSQYNNYNPSHFHHNNSSSIYNDGNKEYKEY